MMQLHGLTPAEIDFLAAPAAVPDSLQSRLGRKLAAVLSARLRLPVRLQPQAAAAPGLLPAAPTWQADAALATLWLTRRLGGQRVLGTARFVPASLIQTLDAALAECWLDAPAQGTRPPVLSWGVATDLAAAGLGIQLPHSNNDMTRWAREIIRHG